MPGTQEIGLAGEANQIAVGLQELFWASPPESPVESVDEVERGVSGDELEGSVGSGLVDFHD